MKIKEIFFLLAVVFFSSAIATFGQTTETNNKDVKKFAVLFQVNDFLSFSGFDGATFSGEYFFNEKSGLRIGVSTAYLNSDVSTSSFVNDTLQYSKPGNGDRTKIGFSAIFVRNLIEKNNLSFFAGVGISYWYNKSNSENTDWTGKENIDSSLNAFGIPFVAGVEWFVKDNISLSLEYGVSLNYQKGERTQTRISDSNTVRNYSVNKSYELDTENIKMGLAVYF